jgi:HD-GYP domain-containing protein (c-di-GMP phosphodiesterase class II)
MARPRRPKNVAPATWGRSPPLGWLLAAAALLAQVRDWVEVRLILGKPEAPQPDPRRTRALRSVLRLLGLGLWALTTVRLVTTYSGPMPRVDALSVWGVSAVGFLLGLLLWSLPRTRLQVEHLSAAVVIGIALPVLYLNITGTRRSGDLLTAYIVAAVFAAALLPVRTATAAALLATIAAVVPLVAGWTAYYGRSLLVLVSVIGLLTYIHARILGTLRADKRELEHQRGEMEESFVATISALAASIFAKDRSVEAHSRGTATLAVAVGRRLGLQGQELRLLEYAALLHDVGKVGIPGYLLSKPTPLTTEELAAIRQHPVIAERILSSVPALAPICPVIRAQYEQWNGTGYPDGLAGDAIPIGARVIHACAAYNAMASDRPYRPARESEEIVRELREQAGRQFDPAIVEALVRVVESGEVGSVASQSSQRVEGRESSRAWTQQLEGLGGLGSRLGLESSVEGICRVVGETIVSLMSCDQCRIFLMDDDHTELRVIYLTQADREEYRAITAEGLSVKVGQGITGWVAESGRGVVVGDAERHAKALHIDNTAFIRESMVAAPVIHKAQVLGVIVVTRLGLNQYSRDHLRLLMVLANQMATSIINARLIERFESVA